MNVAVSVCAILVVLLITHTQSLNLTGDFSLSCDGFARSDAASQNVTVMDLQECGHLCLVRHCEGWSLYPADDHSFVCSMHYATSTDLPTMIPSPGTKYYDKNRKEKSSAEYACTNYIYRDCEELYDAGYTKSGVYTLFTPRRIEVFCDMTDGDGWTLLQRHVLPRPTFNVGWQEYKDGFGSLYWNHWLGNDNIHSITSQDDYDMKMVVEDYHGNTYIYHYYDFVVANETENYRASFSRAQGSHSHLANPAYFDNQLFSTADNDNDNGASNCAEVTNGGFWFNNCFRINPTSKICTENDSNDNAYCMALVTTSSEIIKLKSSKMLMKRHLRATDCDEHYDNGHTTSGIYTINPEAPFDVYCDMSDGGGWIVFQRHATAAVDFAKTFAEYGSGFGALDADHWLGNDYLHTLTSQNTYKLKMVYEGYDNVQYWHEHSTFSVGSSATKYLLALGGYSSSHTTLDDPATRHNGRMFTTLDSDNDLSGSNCASLFKGAWWYQSCFTVNPNAWFCTDVDANRCLDCISFYISGGCQKMKSSLLKMKRV